MVSNGGRGGPEDQFVVTKGSYSRLPKGFGGGDLSPALDRTLFLIIQTDLNLYRVKYG